MPSAPRRPRSLRQPKPNALLTTDSDDVTKLCGNQVLLVHP